MKKILVGILGIFMVLGGALFAACGPNRVDINLSETYKEIVVLDSDNVEPATITAEIVGISDGRVTATSSQNSIVMASAQYDSSSNSNIITLVPGESEGTATVTVTSFDQSVSKNITVFVHGEVTGMSQGDILSTDGKRYDYAIRGGSVTLNGANLIAFEKTLNTNRTAVTWSVTDGAVGYHIEDDGVTLVVDSDYVGSTVTVEATSVYNPSVSTTITLQVLDNIDLSNLQMRYSYSEAFGDAYDLVSGSVIELTSNIQAGGYKRAHIEFGLNENQDLQITPVVKNQDGLDTDMVTILGAQSPNESSNRYFIVEGKDSANLTVNAYFEVGYRDFAYSQRSTSFQVESYLRVESIGVSSQYGDFASIKQGDEVTDLPTQNIYTSYGQGAYGEKFDVQILPIGVADPDADLYYIEVTYPNDLGSQIEFTSQTLQFYYIGVDGVVRQLSFTRDSQSENLFISEQLSVDSVSSLYVRANAQEPWQSLSGVQVQFRSVANELVSAVGQFNLYHSADSLDFGDVETDVNFASNEVRTETKTLTLYGQTDITGLSVYSNFEYVTVSGINLIESNIEENSVTFSFTITMNQNGLGLTETGHYTIAHANGLREDYQINLFLPLTSASLGYDISTETNGRTDYDENGLLYVMVDGLPVAVDGSQRGISSIMVKKGLSVLLSGQTNRSSARNAAARVTIEYADLSNEDYQDESLREAFRNLTPNDVLGRELSTIGGIVSINDNSSASGQFNFTMTALQEGYAWVVVTFSGYNENFEEVQYKRIFFVESHVAPNEWSLSRTEVEVYARNSVADEDLPETSVQVRLTFSNEAVTYRNASVNFIFEAVNSRWGTKRVDGVTENSIKLISWQNGNFTISNVNIYDTYMTFEVNGLTTNGNNEITDFLRISYVIPDADNEGRYLFRLDNVLTVNVMNADRVEYVNWLSYREDGIYYELTDITHENIVLVMQTSPTNAKNSNLRFYLTNSMGAEANFISVSEIDGNGVVRLNATSGASGYLYVLPEDAINDGVINFMVNGVADSIRLSELGMVRAGYNGTNYDYLVEENNAYFVNNNDQNIYFSDLIVRIPVLVADGMSFDTAYRIYTSEQFATLNPRQYYTVMNSITLDNQFASFENISGGIQGENQDVTITLSGKNIAQEVSGEIRNITFAGSVRGAGFVADANSGTITNVSVDVAVTVEDNAQTFSSSTLTSTETAGGIVGTNTGTINGASVLGLTISADGQIVGGVAGQNSGTIENSRVEFYNFEGGVNTFTGATVGGLVGEMTGGEISRSYAYDYTMQSSSQQAVLNGNSGAFVGSATGGSVNESFSVVGTSNAAQGTISITNSYVSYYDDNDTYTSIYYGQDGKVADEESLSSPFITSGSNGFLSYVNGGHAHLDFYQDEAYSNTEDLALSRAEYNNFVQSLGAEGNKGVLFFFQPSTMPVDGLSEDEERDIENYNSISTADLLGISEEDARKVVITSSNVNVVLAQNDGIVVRGVGEAVLTIYSQQDYQNSKTINVEVIYSMSKLVASYNFAGGSVEIAENEDGTTEVPLQETRSLRVAYAFAQNSVYLGNSASIYTLAQNDIDIEYSAAPNDSQGVALREEASGYFITLNAEVGDVNTLICADPKVEGLGAEYQSAVTTAFQSRYTVAPFAGAIRIDATNDEVNMSPGTPGYITAVVLSTNDAERLTANISLGGIDLTISPIERGNGDSSGSYTFTASLGTQERFNVNVSWTRGAKSEDDGTYEYTFEFYFAVAEDYRNHVSANENYDVTFISNSQIVSQNFTLTVSRQEFNNIAVSNYEISSTTYENVGGQYLTVYTIDPSSTISTVAPGSASIIQVNVNPAYAYYDSFAIEYRTVGGSGVANAVMLDFLSPRDDTVPATQFIRNRTATITPITNGYDITPTDDDKASGNLYFRAWINDAVNEDTQIEYRITFFANEESVGYVTYYQKVSYLRDAQISIVGQVGEDGVLAKGETVTVRVTIEDNETVNLESIVLLNSAGGITRSNPTEVASTIPNTRAFEFTVSATVTAQTITESGERLPLQISATVSRIENNVPQTKTVSLALNLVDFRIDGNNIRLDSPIEGEFVTYVGLPQYLQFEYNFLPEDYTYNASDTASVTAVKALREARQSLQSKGYYDPADNMLQNYTINVRDDKEVPLIERLEYFDTSIGQWANVSAGRTLNGIATVSAAQDGTVAIEGLQETADDQEIQMRMATYETVNGVEREYTTSFTVSVEAYSSEDVPICIYTVDEFMAMAGGTAQDYILMNDLHLTGYTPFDTTNISSFDGNGYTIHIDSFNVIPSDTSTLNLALFNNVTSNTTLKNVRVNIFNGGQILADVSRYSQINIAGFAINNAGTITNCDVVAYSADGSYNSSRAYGLNVTYINGSGTSSPVYLPPNSTWQTTVSGFVNENSGSITNSRVGGDEVMVVSDEAGEGLYRLNTYSLQTFNISAQGDVAGFVGQNSGKIAASYVKNVEIDNLSEDPDKNTAGFVLTNNGSVITSYIEGVRGDKTDDDDNFTNTGSSISSANGIVAGFVYSNEDTAQIIDSYSNILISNVNEGSAAYLAAGFVYANTGYLKNCYSASQVENLKYSQMNFSGVDENGNLMTSGGRYENCYYYNSSFTSQYSSGSTTEEDFNTGAGQLRDVSLASNFYGFAVSTSDSDDSIWKMTDEGIKLVEANLLTLSHRYYNVIEDGENVSGETGATVGDDGEIITYNMPYSTLQSSNGTLYSSAYGSIYNPILIRSAQEFVEVTGTSSSSSVQIYLRNKKISGTYRLVADIDLSTLLTSEDEQTYVLPSSSRAFTGIFYGNGFTISNISITSSESVFSYGLFGTIEKDDTTANTLDTMILNLNLTVSRVSNNAATTVGALSGYVRDAKLINISATFNDDSRVEGLNFAGGLAGLVFNNSLLSNLSVENAMVIADRYNSEIAIDSKGLLELRSTLYTSLSGLSTNKSAYEMTNLKNQLISYSYAGGIAGFVDIFTDGARNANFTAEDYSTTLNGQGFNVYGTRATGNTYVEGNIVGGLFGLTGSKTHVRDARIEIEGTMNQNSTHIIATRYYAGGVVGQSFGALSQIVATYSDDVLSTINNNYGTYYSNRDMTAERGAIDIFYYGDLTDYTQEYIGGLVGYAGSGSMRVSYSTINAIGLDSKFAGGVIGVIDIGTDVTPYSFNPGNGEVVATKYAIEEVYSSGDVRANTMSGGIVGVIAKANTNVSFSAVNSVNFLSIYDYQNGVNYTNQQLGSAGEDGSYSGNTGTNVLKFYSIVGQFNTDDDVTTTNIEGNYLTFNQVFESYFDDDGMLAYNDFVSIGKFKDYNFTSGTRLTLTNQYYPGYGSDSIGATFLIETPSSYTDSTAGRTYTRAAFLDSNAWSDTNWVHYTGQLYPEIRYADLQEATLYLDYYNVADIIKIMNNNPDVEVMVRGLISEDAELENPNSYRDVVLTTTQQIGTTSNPFAGTLFGNSEYEVSLVVNNTLFEATGSGLVLRDLDIAYGEESDTSNTNLPKLSGGVIAPSLLEAQIANVTLTINKTASVEMGSSSDTAGLVAGSITSTSIQGLRIVDNVASSANLLNVSDSNTQSTTESDTENESNTTWSVGLVAGEARQGSSVREMTISQISISLNSNRLSSSSNSSYSVINITGGNPDTLNAGLYFGQAVSEEENTFPFDITLSGMSVGQNPFGDGNNLGFAEIYVGVNATNVNVGGYIGNVGNITSVSGNFTNRPLNFAVKFANDMKSTEQKPTSLNYGGLIGKSQALALSLRYTQSNDLITVYNQLTRVGENSFSVGSMNYGGLIGEVVSEGTSTGAAPTISGLTAHNSLFGSDNENVSLNTALTDSLSTALTNEAGTNVEDSLKGKITFTDTLNYGGLVGTTTGANITNFQGGSTNDDNLLTFTGATEANVGGVVGNSAGSVTISAVSGGANVYDSYNIQAGTINAGGLVGNSGGGVSISGTIGNDGSMVINATGITSTNNSDTASANNVGGFVGSVTGNVNITGTGEKNLSQYTGHIFINSASTANVGGIVGNITSGVIGNGASENDRNQGIVYTSFGGTIRIAKASTIRAGGTIGHLGITESPSIQHNYNYGDIYISNGVVESSNNLDLYAGGIIGISDYTANVSGSNISDNYSLVAINSGKYSQENENINALFGSSVQGTETNTNFYNHGVALCTDDFGTDMGYASAYTNGVSRTENAPYTYTYHAGYGEYYVPTTEEQNAKSGYLLAAFTSAGLTSTTSGHKLNPTLLSSTIAGVKYPENGVYYIALDKDSSIRAQLLENVSKNIALIGDGYTLTYTGNSNSFIPELSGFSYVSSLVLNVDVNIDDTTNENIGGLVGNMTIGQIYAVGVSGNIEVGGTTAITVAGLVANAGANVTVRDSYAVADILYRAGIEEIEDDLDTPENESETVYGSMSGLVGSGSASIYGSFSGGRLSTYIDANMYAFSQGSHTITNSYTYTTLDWNDHTSEKTEPADTTIISVFGSVTNESSNLYYDAKALNRSLKNDTNKGSAFGTSTTMSTDGWGTFNLKIGDREFKDTNGLYNFGYSVRSNFKYLAPSSLYTRPEADDSDNGDDISYEDCIKEYDYTRLSLEKTLYLIGNDNNNASNTAYGIPNYTVLTKMIGQVGNKYNIYVLTNDIDNYENTSSSRKNWTPTSLGVSELDGNGHTINNLGATMFTSLSTSSVKQTVRNIRLTNDNNLHLAYAILAQSLKTGTTISNVTLSGYIVEGDESKNLAALAGLADGTDITINAVTNLAHVRKTGKNTDNCAGGLIGYVNDGANVTINYSSNYGTIQNDNGSSKAGNDNAKTAHAGGLVGGVGGTLTIENSYNANSVIVNYTSTSDEKDMTTHAGGLVGWATGTVNISNSYNSGIVKAGNKKVGTNGSSVSYAGGIIGYGTTGKIENCFNEGSIEALGKNPEFELGYTIGIDEKRILEYPNMDTVKGAFWAAGVLQVSFYGIYNYYIKEVYVEQKSELSQNVYALGIGYLTNNSQEEDNGDNYNNGNIKNNGTKQLSNEGDRKLAIVDMTDKTKITNGSILYQDRGYVPVSVASQGVFKTRPYYNATEENGKYNINFDNLGYDQDFYNSKINPNSAVIIKSTGFDENGMPVSAVIKVPNVVTVGMSSSWTATDKSYVNADLYSIDFQSGGLIDYQSKFETDGVNVDVASVDTNNIETIRSSTRSKEAGSYETIEINGESYYLANSNNVNALFSAGVYSYTLEVDVDQSWQYLSARDLQLSNPMVGSTSVNARVSQIYIDQGQTKVSIIISSSEPFSGNFTATLSANYQTQSIVDISNFVYYYDVETELYGILTNYSTEELGYLGEGYTLSSGSQVYQGAQVIQLLKSDRYNEINNSSNDNSAITMPGFEDSDYIYMIWDENDKALLYLPNATLKDPDGQDYDVNATPFTNIIAEEISYNNIYISAEETIQVAIDFSEYQHNETLIETAGEDDVEGTISVGEVLSDMGGQINTQYDSEITLNFSIKDTIEGVSAGTYDLVYKGSEESIIAQIVGQDIDGVISFTMSGVESTTIGFENYTFVVNYDNETGRLILTLSGLDMTNSGLLQEAERIVNAISDLFVLRYEDESQVAQEISFDQILNLTYTYQEKAGAFNITGFNANPTEFMLLDQNIPMIARSNSGSFVVNEEQQVTFTINDIVYTARFEVLENNIGVRLVFNEQISNDILAELQSQIRSYLSGLMAISNNENENSMDIEDLFPEKQDISDSIIFGDEGQFTIGYNQVIGKDWILDETLSDIFEITKHENGDVTISVKDEAITVYTLGDVEIYRYEYEYSLRQSWWTERLSATLSTQSQEEKIMAGLTLKGVTQTGDLISGISNEVENITDENINLIAEIYSQYHLAENDNYSISAIIEKDNSYASVVLVYNNESSSWQLGTVGYIYAVEGNNYGVISVKTTDGTTIWYDTNENTILRLEDGVYTTYYNSQYNYYEQTHTSLPETIYTSATLSDGTSGIPGTSFDTNNFMIFENIEESYHITEDGYLYFTNGYAVVNKLNDRYYTQSERDNVVSGYILTFPKYEIMEYKPNIGTVDLYEIKDDKVVYKKDENENKINILWKKDASASSAIVTFSIGGNKVLNTSVSSGSSVTPGNIILMQDISLAAVTAGIDKNELINISGNDYLLSFYSTVEGTSLYNSTISKDNNGYFKNIKFLVELNNASLLPSNSSTNYINLSGYGVVNSASDGYGLFADTTINGQTNNAISRNLSFENNISIVGIDGTNANESGSDGQKGATIGFAESYKSETFEDENGEDQVNVLAYFEKLTNYGFIDAGDGGTGYKGNDGESSRKAGLTGGDGGDGGSILWQGSLDNYGLLKLGDAGNAGAGGTGYNGKDAPQGNNVKNIGNWDETIDSLPGDEGSPGDNGNKGNLPEDSDIKTGIISGTGIEFQSTTGGRGRFGFGGIGMFQETWGAGPLAVVRISSWIPLKSTYYEFDTYSTGNRGYKDKVFDNNWDLLVYGSDELQDELQGKINLMMCVFGYEELDSIYKGIMPFSVRMPS